MLRLFSANEYTSADVVPLPGAEGSFQVKSQDASQRSWYTVDLTKPTCGCMDWKERHMLCKHILAIWNHFKDFSWYTLPQEYRESPLFTIDTNFITDFDENEEDLDEVEEESREDVVDKRVWKNEKEEKAQVTIMKNEESVNEGTVFAQSVDSDDDFVSAVPPKALTKEIREELTRIKDLSFLCQDQGVLRSCLNTLVETRKQIQEVTPRCGEWFKRSTPTKKMKMWVNQ